MLIAFTGAGISRASGITTFQEQPGIRDKLVRTYADRHKDKYARVIEGMQAACKAAKPNDAHAALAERGVPIITMNVDGLHGRAGSKHVVELHGRLPDIVLYGDPAPEYQTAMSWLDLARPGDTFLIVGTSFYTGISTALRRMAKIHGMRVHEINADAEHEVRKFLDTCRDSEKFEEFMAREI